MIKREDFCRVMDELEQKERRRDKWLGDMEHLLGCSFGNPIYDNSYYSLLVDLIELAADCTNRDEYGNSWITWWIFEADYGKTSLEVDCNGKKFFPKTPSDLYDIILFERCKAGGTIHTI